MSYARQILDTYRATMKLGVDVGALATVVDAAADCVQACSTDTDADLSEPNLAEMVACIRLCQDCADICTTTAAVLSRPATLPSRVVRPLLEACAAICQTCGDECQRHAPRHAHCRVCAEACSELACSELLTITTRAA